MRNTEMQRKKIIIYGIGNNCKQFIQYALYTDFTVVAFVDEKKKGTIFEGQIVKSPTEILELEYDEIYVTIADNKAVISNLISLGVDPQRIRENNYISYKYMVNVNTKADVVLITDGAKLYNYVYLELEKLNNLEVWRPLMQNTKWECCGKESQRNLIFLVHSHCYGYHRNSGFMKWLKGIYPNSKYVLILSDMIDGDFGYRNRKDETHIDIEKERADFDLITTYHPLDAEKYDFNYHVQPYTKINLSDEEIEYDLFFVGHAKNRLEKLYNIYDYLTANGFKCNFWITGVDKNLIDTEKKGIKYNQFLDYDNYLREMNKCKCILEICQIGDVTTVRYVEAVVYGKKLISNDNTCINYPCYDEKYINIISDEKNIDIEWLKKDERPNYKYSNEFSPILLLERIKFLLGEKNG